MVDIKHEAFMKKLMAILFSLLMAACVPHHDRTRSMETFSNPGSAVVVELNRRYNLTYPNCWNSETAPSFLCSGVVVRGTYRGNWNVWDPSPANVAKGGMAFSFLRKDSTMKNLYSGINNGFIVYPASATPANMLKLSYLCFFPVDSDTWNRADRGCGEHSAAPVVSRYCTSQNIFTAAQFAAHYNSFSSPQAKYECSFDVRDSSAYATASLFREGLKAMYLIPRNHVNSENELTVQTWSTQPAAKMPLEAFFFLSGNANGLVQAQENQRSFYEKSGGRIVPIVQLTIAASHQASFQYDVNHQIYK